MEKSRILIVDDEKAIRTSLSDFLGGSGYDVAAVENGYKAIEKVKDEDWDLALVDLKMPGLDGLAVLREIINIKPHLLVMIITGYATIESAVEAMKEGATDYIMKPFAPDELVIRIEKALEKARLASENVRLRDELAEKYEFCKIIGKSEVMQGIFRLIEKVAPTDATILIRGQSGTGKELIARAVHYNSLRRDKRFIAVDCGALPETLLESELFGHIRGSFTGAVVTKRGLLEVADGGTFFLDEVGDLSLGTQSKLLRVLQEREFRPVGGVKSIKVDVRLIAATNKNLEEMIKQGKFREDLFYRVNTVPIYIPPLKERKEDIPLLVHHFLEIHNEKRDKKIKGLSSEVMNVLIEYDFPGNVRELENVIERLVIMSDKDVIEMRHLPLNIQKESMLGDIYLPKTSTELKQMKKRLRVKAVEEIERAFLTDALKRNEWNISKAARDVGMKRQNFQALMRKYRL